MIHRLALIISVLVVLTLFYQEGHASVTCKNLKFQPFLPLETTAGIFGQWFLFEHYGVRDAPVCEYVDFYEGQTNLTFRKKLNTHLNDGSWKLQYQNGTITSPGEVMLDFTYANGSLTNPPLQINYTLIGFDPEEYMIVFYCKNKATVPQIPVLTRKLNPSKKVWNEIFSVIQNAGLNFAWLDLMCRPPPSNATAILSQAKVQRKQQELREFSVSSNTPNSIISAIYSYFAKYRTPFENALFAQQAVGQYTTKLLSHVLPSVF